MEDEPEYQISVTAVGVSCPVAERALADAAAATLRLHGMASARIHFALVGDCRIAELNRQHLAHEGPTDVLTFDLKQPDSIHDDGDQPDIDGEVVISVDTAAREASARGHGLAAELALYAVHGVLHLLGLDDRDEPSARRMHAMEDRILSELGYGAVYGESAP
ncbi:MAG: rRNA maturation RNase YbeY [Phycisphaerae bacterium]